MIDFSFHHTDYSNEIDIIFLLKEGENTFSNIKNYDTSFLIFLKSFFSYILFLYLDISIIIVQIIFSIFKLLIAFYLLWLVVDLFILKVFCLKESNKFTNKFI
jgi:hypothetical protein